jgi:hypothetical protein
MSVFDLIEGYLIGLPFRDLDDLEGFDSTQTKGFRSWDRLRPYHIRSVDRGCLNKCRPSAVRNAVVQIIKARSRREVAEIIGSVI